MNRTHRLNPSQLAVSLVLVSYTMVYLSWTWLHWWGDPVVVSDVAPLPLVAAATFLLWRRASQGGALSVSTRFLALACSCWLVGDAIWYYLEVFTHQEPFPSAADVFYLAFYPLAFVGLLAVPVLAHRQRDSLTLACDALTVAVAGLMVLWYLVIGPTIAGPGDSWLSTTLAVSYPIGDLVLVLGVTRVLLRRPVPAARTGLRAFLAGLGCLVVADVTFASLDLQGHYLPGSLPDAFWALGFLALSLAALRMRAEATTTIDVVEQRAPLTTIPFGGVLVGLGVLALQAAAPHPGTLVAVIIAAGVLGVVLVSRQGILQRDHEETLSRLEWLANTDPLTELPNRRHFFEVGAARAAKALARGETVAALTCDIDDFKLVNDVYGHATGDKILQALARRCRQAVRSSDITARIGGDEFALLLVDCTPSRAYDLAEALSSVSLADGDETVSHVIVGVSVGVAIASDARPLADLLHEADAVLYDTKRAKKHHTEAPCAENDGARQPGDATGSRGLRRSSRLTVNREGPIRDV